MANPYFFGPSRPDFHYDTLVSRNGRRRGVLTKKIFLVTTETSGDLLAGKMLAVLKDRVPDLAVSGVGGDLLKEQGMETIFHVRDFSVMGLFEVLSQLKRLKGMFNQLKERVKTDRPDLIVLVDAPDFNIRFAKAVKGLGIPVVYYVSPQVWAWRKKRAGKLAKLVDHMMVLFSFEVDIYKKYGLPTSWVGHPLVDELKDLGDRDAFMAANGLDPNLPLVALAPGSRNQEVRRLLPVMAQVAEARLDKYQFVIPLAGTIDASEAQSMLGWLPVPILQGKMREVMHHADAAVVASGTATLETGLLRTPMIVGYKLKSLTYYMARLLVKAPHIALVNIILGKRVVPELVQDDFQVRNVLPLLDQLLRSGKRRAQILQEFDRLESILGGGGAAVKAATVIEGFLKS